MEACIFTCVRPDAYVQIDDMGARIDDLERCIAELMEEAGAPLPGQGDGPGK